MSPKRSAASQPEFFVDRSLGPSTTAHLRRLRWIVHLVNDHFEYDGQFVPGEAWIEYGLQHGWALLTKDQKIRYRADELLPLAEHGKMFCLSNGNLTIEQQASTLLYATALACGVVYAVENPVRNAFVAELVEHRLIPPAVNPTSTVGAADRVLGPLGAGVCWSRPISRGA